MNLYKRVFKSFFDVSIATILLVLLSPVFVVLMIFLFIVNNGHPLYFQRRPGLNGKVFKIIKFKTMNDRNENGILLPDDQRLTLVGKFVRKTSMDEMPQLINVIKMDMSLVGPRPLLVEYLPLYDDIQIRRHEVRPGITGWAQVNGRNAITWKQKFEYYVWYVDNLSLKLDWKIIILTIIKVFKSEGISSSSSVSMEKFSGN